MRAWWVAALAPMLVSSACTEAKLFGQKAPTTADIVAFKGRLCTSDPTERAFPVRVLFLVDTSVAEGSYISARADSIERVTRQYAGPNYSYSIIRYSGILKGTTCGLRNLTPDGFTKNIEDAVAGVAPSHSDTTTSVARIGAAAVLAGGLMRAVCGFGSVLGRPRVMDCYGHMIYRLCSRALISNDQRRST